MAHPSRPDVAPVAYQYALLRILFGLIGCLFLFGLRDLATFWDPTGLVPLADTGWRAFLNDHGWGCPRALKKLGYAEETSEAIVEYIAEHGHVVDAPGLRPEHYEVFDTAMGQRAIKPMGHVRMMAASQPFLSGAISKTVNLPETATVEEIADVYMQGWKLGLKGAGGLSRQLQRPG